MIEDVSNVREYFKEKDNVFTIYVVEQKFVVGRGHDYLYSYKGKPNYIDSDIELEGLLQRILNKITKAVPDIAAIIEKLFSNKKSKSIPLKETISLVVKLITPNEHQAAGPDVIDPIIIQEGKVSVRSLTQFISLHKESILRPSIIILLKDNNFDRAKDMLKGCPHGINVKFIKNSGETETIRIINPGVDSADDFIDAYASHCFSTCSRTAKSIILGDNFEKEPSVETYALEIMRIRTILLYGDKTIVKEDLNGLLRRIAFKEKSSQDIYYLKSLEAILKLLRLFCNDGGSRDILDARAIAEELDNEILKAHVMRNSYFIPGISRDEMNHQMEKAYKIFSSNGIEDYAIYSRNNKYVRQFDTSTLDVNGFIDLQAEALNAVPGLVGMSHIINNAGAALLTYGQPEASIVHFKKALDYTIRPERAIQDIAVRSNMAIAMRQSYVYIKETELRKILDKIFLNQSVLNLPFLSARYALNIISIAYSQNKNLGKLLMEEYEVQQLIQRALNEHPLGSGQLILQIQTMISLYGNIPKLAALTNKKPKLDAMGIRKKYIERTGFNPCSFSTWF